MDKSIVLDNLAEISHCGFREAMPISAEPGEGMAEFVSVIYWLRQEKSKRISLLLITTSEDEWNKADDAVKPPSHFLFSLYYREGM